MDYANQISESVPRIGGYARRKAVAQDWYSNGDLQGNFKMSGKIEIIQQSEYDISDVDVQLKGLSQNSGYHVHLVSYSHSRAAPVKL